jgi:hypothetical protein
MRERAEQIALIVAFGAICWLGMQIVHELGHVTVAVASGGTVEKVVLHPLAMSRTDVGTNPHPALQVWAGPVVGVLLPLVAWVVACACRAPGSYLFRTFAGFCCIANGTYIAFGPSDTGMDTEIMLLLGASRWQLVLFGVPCIVLGLYLWNGQGHHFGFGKAGGHVSRPATVACAVLLVVIVAAELALA